MGTQTRLRGRALAAAIGFCCGCGFLLLGYDQGVMGGVVGYSGNTFAHVFHNPSPLITGVMVSVYEVGCLFGALLILFLGEAFGRQRALVTGGCIVLLGTILQTTSYSRVQFIIARVVTGLGNGINTSTLGVYQSETCSAGSRGKLVTAEGIQALCGVMIAYWLDFGMSYTKSTAQWRFPIAFQAVFTLGMVVTACFLPETPRWLTSKGRHEEARQVIAALADAEEDDAVVKELHDNIQRTVDYETALESESTWREFFAGGETQNFRRMCLCFGIQFMEEMGGINMITYYMSIIFQSVGLTHTLAQLISGVNATVFFLSAIIPIWLVDRIGRKPLLVYGSIGMTISMAVLVGTLSPTNPTNAEGIVSIICIFLFEIFYSTGGWMATPFLYPAEISVLRFRSKGAAVSIVSKWAWNFLVVMITPVAIANIGYRTYIMWAVLNFVFIFVVYFFYPETKGLSLEETDNIFIGGDKITRGAIGFGVRKVSGRGSVADIDTVKEEGTADFVEKA